MYTRGMFTCKRGVFSLQGGVHKRDVHKGVYIHKGDVHLHMGGVHMGGYIRGMLTQAKLISRVFDFAMSERSLPGKNHNKSAANPKII